MSEPGRGWGRGANELRGPQGPSVLLDGRSVLMLCSDNYLGMADHPRVRTAASEAIMRWGVGAGATRRNGGNLWIHRRLEERLAAFLGTEAALLFGSAYLANVGTIAALASDPEGTVLSDELNHPSIVDGCRLARARSRVYRHRDLDHLEQLLREAGRPALIVTDAVFARDGDVAPLAELVELAARYGARVVVDEARATGCLGPGGRGAVAEAGVGEQVDIVIGTLGKSLGSYGAFVACDRRIASFLVERARPLAFSTAPPPSMAAAALAALELLEARPQLPLQLQENATVLRDSLLEEGFDVGASRTQIVSATLGAPDAASRICETALADGAYAGSVCPPVAAPGTSLLRFTVTSAHLPEQLRWAARTFAAAGLPDPLGQTGRTIARDWRKR